MSSVVPIASPSVRQIAPPAPYPVLLRPLLLQRLEAAASQRICTLIAPTGSGKTVLLNQYFQANSSRKNLIWLRLNDAVNEPVGLLRQLAAALRNAIPDFDGFVSLQQEGDAQQTRLALTALVGGLQRLEQPVQIIIDNFELLDDAHWKPLLQHLLELSPASVQWILSGRHTTSIDADRWKLRDELGQIEQSDLFFSRDETRTLLDIEGFKEASAAVPVNQGLTDDPLQRIFQYTRGWPAGVKLAQVYLQRSNCTLSPGQDLFGKHVFVDLCNGVLQTLPPALQQFLVQTALLDSFSVPLCDYMLHSVRGAEHIRQLQELGLFIEADPAQSVFHYHALFRHHLLQLFRQMPLEQQDRMIARACAWLVDNGQREAACRLAREHSQRGFFVEVLQRSFHAWFKAGRGDPVFYWARELGEKALLALPETRFAWCWALTMFGRWNDAESLLARTPVPTSGAMQQQSDPASLVLQSIIRLFRCELDDGQIELLQRLYKLPELSRDLRASIDNIMAQHAIHHCQYQEARKRASQAALMLEQSGNLFGQTLAQYLIANASFQNNDIRNALAACDQYLEQRPLDAEHPSRALLAGFRAYLLYQGEQPLRAEQLINEVLAGSQPGYSIDLQLYLYVPLIRLRARRGQFVAAHELLQELEAAAGASASPLFQAHTRFEALRLAYAKGNGNELQRLAAQYAVEETARQALDPSLPLQWETREYRVMAGIILYTHLEQFDRARALALQLLHLNVDHGYPIRFLPINMYIAFLDLCLGQISSAYRRLNDTLTQAEATGMLMGLIDDLPGMDDMLRLALSHQRILNPEHVSRVRAMGILELQAPAATPVLAPQEQEITRLLLQGLSVHDIADHLQLSLTTVQWHLQRILYKMDARQIGDLVPRLRQLDILPSS